MVKQYYKFCALSYFFYLTSENCIFEFCWFVEVAEEVDQAHLDVILPFSVCMRAREGPKSNQCLLKRGTDLSKFVKLKLCIFKY